jgi:acyl-CoA hydrolase
LDTQKKRPGLKHQKEEIQYFSEIESCIDKVISKVGKTIKLGIPLAAGKPNQFVNALYLRAKQDPDIDLTILTALTLQKPKGKSLLEKRFMEPFAERIFGNYPDLLYELDRTSGKLPPNIKIIEFYFPAGKFTSNKQAQRDYISSNYTHVARDLIDRGVNVIAQIVSKSEDGKRLSLSCNPDVTPDIIKELKGKKNVAFVAQVNNNLPYMFGDADVPIDTFHYIIDNPVYDFKLFGPPKMSIPDPDYMIGFYASTLVKDGGELQVGIGSLGDALIYSLLLRHQQNDLYKKIFKAFDVEQKFEKIITARGDIEPFQTGLFGASEMFVDAFMFLMKNGILKRKVYDHYILQRLLNEGLIDENKITPEAFYLLLARGAIHANLTQKDFDFLQHFGILKKELIYQNGIIIFEDGLRIAADLNIDESNEIIIDKGLGNQLKNGAIVHGGFFLGPTVFYEWLKNLPEEKRKLIQMKSVRAINQLYGHEALDRLHRKDARFFNTCLMMTLSGAAVSDGLENGTVVSGVGGQYNFVEMAHALPDGHSVIQLRATRTSEGKVHSNFVWNYGHITIPRHLRDIVISEYGIADIRGKTDEEIIKLLIQIADSRFQPELIAKAVKSGKLSSHYKIPEPFRNNYPEVISKKLSLFKKEGHFPVFPFGTDLTKEEQIIGKALKGLKKKTARPLSAMMTILKALIVFGIPDEIRPYLKRMQLDKPKNFKESLYQKLLISELKASDHLLH